MKGHLIQFGRVAAEIDAMLLIVAVGLSCLCAALPTLTGTNLLQGRAS
jgi:hypothetical protein